MKSETTQRLNDLQQPIGEDVANWKGAKPPEKVSLVGAYATLEPLSKEDHQNDLFEAISADTTGKMWTYMPAGPFFDQSQFGGWIDWACASNDPLFFAILDNTTKKAVGFASFLRISPEPGVIEVGYIAFSPLLQRTPIATEAMYLMMKHVFEELGYRRYEWKLDNLNAPSHRAAQRLGFTYDGLFRQALVYKGRNRDTAWYSILDSDWPRLKQGFESWLAPGNMDGNGHQKSSLSELILLRRKNRINIDRRYSVDTPYSEKADSALPQIGSSCSTRGPLF